MKESQLHAMIYVVIAHPEICTPAQYPFPKILDIDIPGHTFVKYFSVNVYPSEKARNVHVQCARFCMFWFWGNQNIYLFYVLGEII